MITELEEYYLQKEEPVRGCLLGMRDFILNFNSQITEAFSYRMPMFKLNGKLFCYLWTMKDTGIPYIGIYNTDNIEHPGLIRGDRKRVRIMHLDPEADLPVEDLEVIFMKLIS